MGHLMILMGHLMILMGHLVSLKDWRPLGHSGLLGGVEKLFSGVLRLLNGAEKSFVWLGRPFAADGSLFVRLGSYWWV